MENNVYGDPSQEKENSGFSISNKDKKGRRVKEKKVADNPAPKKAADNTLDYTKIPLADAIPDSLSSKEEILSNVEYVNGLLKKVNAEEYIGNLKICMNCGEKNNRSTRKCPFCGENFPLDTIVDSEFSDEFTEDLLNIEAKEATIMTASMQSYNDNDKKMSEDLGRKLSDIFKDDLADIDDDDDDNDLNIPLDTVDIPDGLNN